MRCAPPFKRYYVGLVAFKIEGAFGSRAVVGKHDAVVFERIYKKAFRELDAMPPEDHIDIKYEDFCKDPEGYVKQIYDHLGIDGFEEAKPYFDAYLESQKNYQKNKFELTPELRDKINAKLGFYFAHYGYEMQK